MAKDICPYVYHGGSMTRGVPKNNGAMSFSSRILSLPDIPTARGWANPAVASGEFNLYKNGDVYVVLGTPVYTAPVFVKWYEDDVFIKNTEAYEDYIPVDAESVLTFEVVDVASNSNVGNQNLFEKVLNGNTGQPIVRPITSFQDTAKVRWYEDGAFVLEGLVNTGYLPVSPNATVEAKVVEGEDDLDKKVKAALQALILTEIMNRILGNVMGGAVKAANPPPPSSSTPASINTPTTYNMSLVEGWGQANYTVSTDLLSTDLVTFRCRKGAIDGEIAATSEPVEQVEGDYMDYMWTYTFENLEPLVPHYMEYRFGAYDWVVSGHVRYPNWKGLLTSTFSGSTPSGVGVAQAQYQVSPFPGYQEGVTLSYTVPAVGGVIPNYEAPNVIVESSQPHHVRVRHQGTNGEWSEWSDFKTVTFT